MFQPLYIGRKILFLFYFLQFYKMTVPTCIPSWGWDILVHRMRYYKYINEVLKGKITYFERNKWHKIFLSKEYSGTSWIIPWQTTNTHFASFLGFVSESRWGIRYIHRQTEENRLICSPCSWLVLSGPWKKSVEQKPVKWLVTHGGLVSTMESK